jgi:hypothetical protein
MLKKSQPITTTSVDTLADPIAQPVWDAACAHTQAQKEYDRLSEELERAATVLRSSEKRLSTTLKNHAIGSAVIEMNSNHRLVAVFDEFSGQHSFLLLNALPNAEVSSD